MLHTTVERHNKHCIPSTRADQDAVCPIDELFCNQRNLSDNISMLFGGKAICCSLFPTSMHRLHTLYLLCNLPSTTYTCSGYDDRQYNLENMLCLIASGVSDKVPAAANSAQISSGLRKHCTTAYLCGVPHAHYQKIPTDDVRLLQTSKRLCHVCGPPSFWRLAYGVMSLRATFQFIHGSAFFTHWIPVIPRAQSGETRKGMFCCHGYASVLSASWSSSVPLFRRLERIFLCPVSRNYGWGTPLQMSVQQGLYKSTRLMVYGTM